MNIPISKIGLILIIFSSIASAADKNPNVDKRVEALLKKMTLEEKIGQLSEFSWRKKTGPVRESHKQQIEHGLIGSISNLSVDNGANERNELQKIAVEKTRLGIPIIFGYDVIHGWRTIFPIPLGQSSSWEPDLARRAASVAAKEATAAGFDWTFSPMIDIARDPRWGRIAETFGEDTYLTSKFSAAMVKGYQGDDFSSPSSLAACLKHYVGYGAAEGGRDYATCEISERTLREVYLPPFKAGVDAGAATVMSAFNEISGIPTSANRHTLSDILKKEWHFDGFVVSDWTSINELVAHGLAADDAKAAQKAISAGVDMDMEGGLYLKYLPQLIKEGKVSQKTVDEAVRRILRIKFRKGLFEHPYIDANVAESVILCKEHLDLARESAKRSLVLLKNDSNLLPLKKDIKSLAVIGPLADNRLDLLGTWSRSGKAEDVVTIVDGIRAKLAGGCKFMYTKGCDIDSDRTNEIADAVKIAEQADAVIIAVGESAEMSGEAHSRSTLDLPGAQQQLVEAVYATGKPVVVVLLNGRPLSISWIAANVPAVLEAWHPGVQGGNAIADVLFGDYNPSGKLTVTFPRTVGQLPIYYNHKNTGRPPKQDKYSSKYLDLPSTPLYPFGYGLSYTTFEYGNLKLNAAKIKAAQSLTVSADIKNTGRTSGEEIVQLYIQDIAASATRPVRELKGFEKIKLDPGEQKTVSFTLTPNDLAFYNIDMKWTVEPGVFKIWLAPNSAEGLESQFEVIE